MRTILSLALALTFSLSACGNHDTGGGASQGPVPGSTGAAIITSDSTICSEGGRMVYYQPSLMGSPAVCYCAERVARDTGASPETSNLIVQRPNGTTYVVTGVQQGTGSGRWNTSWAAANCP